MTDTVIRWVLPTEEQAREDVQRILHGPRVHCFIKGYPPLEGERMYAYQRRVMPLVMRDMETPSRWSRFKAWLKGE